MDFATKYLNDLNRALELIQPLRYAAMTNAAEYDAWISATNATRDKRDWYREHLANLCAPWFE